MAQPSKTERRFRWEIAAVLVAALIAALSGLAGATIGAKASSDAVLEQIEQDKRATLRQERYEAFSRLFTTADEYISVLDQFSQIEPIAEEANRAYQTAYQNAFLYASNAQSEAMSEVSEAIGMIEQGSAVELYNDARFDLVLLLREDLLFES